MSKDAKAQIEIKRGGGGVGNHFSNPTSLGACEAGSSPCDDLFVLHVVVSAS